MCNLHFGTEPPFRANLFLGERPIGGSTVGGSVSSYDRRASPPAPEETRRSTFRKAPIKEAVLET